MSSSPGNNVGGMDTNELVYRMSYAASVNNSRNPKLYPDTSSTTQEKTKHDGTWSSDSEEEGDAERLHNNASSSRRRSSRKKSEIDANTINQWIPTQSKLIDELATVVETQQAATARHDDKNSSSGSDAGSARGDVQTDDDDDVDTQKGKGPAAVPTVESLLQRYGLKPNNGGSSSTIGSVVDTRKLRALLVNGHVSSPAKSRGSTAVQAGSAQFLLLGSADQLLANPELHAVVEKTNSLFKFLLESLETTQFREAASQKLLRATRKDLKRAGHERLLLGKQMLGLEGELMEQRIQNNMLADTNAKLKEIVSVSTSEAGHIFAARSNAALHKYVSGHGGGRNVFDDDDMASDLDDDDDDHNDAMGGIHQHANSDYDDNSMSEGGRSPVNRTGGGGVSPSASSFSPLIRPGNSVDGISPTSSRFTGGGGGGGVMRGNSSLRGGNDSVDGNNQNTLINFFPKHSSATTTTTTTVPTGSHSPQTGTGTVGAVSGVSVAEESSSVIEEGSFMSTSAIGGAAGGGADSSIRGSSLRGGSGLMVRQSVVGRTPSNMPSFYNNNQQPSTSDTFIAGQQRMPLQSSSSNKPPRGGLGGGRSGRPPTVSLASGVDARSGAYSHSSGVGGGGGGTVEVYDLKNRVKELTKSNANYRRQVALLTRMNGSLSGDAMHHEDTLARMQKAKSELERQLQTLLRENDASMVSKSREVTQLTLQEIPSLKSTIELLESKLEEVVRNSQIFKRDREAEVSILTSKLSLSAQDNAQLHSEVERLSTLLKRREQAMYSIPRTGALSTTTNNTITNTNTTGGSPLARKDNVLADQDPSFTSPIPSQSRKSVTFSQSPPIAATSTTPTTTSTTSVLSPSSTLNKRPGMNGIKVSSTTSSPMFNNNHNHDSSLPSTVLSPDSIAAKCSANQTQKVLSEEALSAFLQHARGGSKLEALTNHHNKQYNKKGPMMTYPGRATSKSSTSMFDKQVSSFSSPQGNNNNHHRLAPLAHLVENGGNATSKKNKSPNHHNNNSTAKSTTTSQSPSSSRKANIKSPPADRIFTPEVHRMEGTSPIDYNVSELNDTSLGSKPPRMSIVGDSGKGSGNVLSSIAAAIQAEMKQ